MSSLPWLPGAVRLFLLLGYVLVMGDLALEASLPSVDVKIGPGRRSFLLGLGFMAIATLLEFVVLVWGLADGDFSQLGDLISSLFMNPGSTGSVLAMRLGLIGALALLRFLWPVLARQPAIAMLASLIFTFFVSVDGHAGDLGWFTPLLATDLVHAMSASIWLGGLMLLWWRLPKMDEALALRYTRVFSRLATICFPLAIVSGIGNGLFHLGLHVSALWMKPYGRIMLAKTLGVAGVMVLAYYLREIALPGWKRGEGSSHKFRKNLSKELVVGVLILTLSAWLTQTSTH